MLLDNDATYQSAGASYGASSHRLRGFARPAGSVLDRPATRHIKGSDSDHPDRKNASRRPKPEPSTCRMVRTRTLYRRATHA
ncbi:hypothetical protein COLSTE_00657 [Collinsella stercoris DSM 13279]|uniref:Uncharacterized protein n=1 Tax=Collinsella stercoris DSM 13279 TaxID=445975 RepID=B6G9B6_9ACTN|nr:hypothetical protein COLSTE_00657 [Collinsella stercoris DSM 13279]